MRPRGFQASGPIPFSLGIDVWVCLPYGEWVYSSQSQQSRLPAKSPLRAGRRRPLVSDLGAVPNVGQRLAILGEPPCVSASHRPGGGYAIDALRQLARCFSEFFEAPCTSFGRRLVPSSVSAYPT